MAQSDTVKGFSDFLGEEAWKREKIFSILRRKFEEYGYEPAETPIIEFEEFVKGDNPDDEAVRDVFRLEDRKKRKLALRYEFTFQLKRIAKKQRLPFRRYQVGYNFRDEPIKKGRTRQFVQADADVVGCSVKDEAENFLLLKEIMDELNIEGRIYINNRRLLNEILVDLDVEERYHEEVIRTIDKIGKVEKKEIARMLKEYDAKGLLEVISQKEDYFEKYSSYKEVKDLKEYCRIFGVDVEFCPYLARGFSYYEGNVFEVWAEKLNVSIAAGGSYRVEEISATGISLGVEPICILSSIEPPRMDYMVLSLGQDKEAINTARVLRNKGKRVIFIKDKTVKKAMEYANSKKIKNVVFVGEEEVERGDVRIKDMQSGIEMRKEIQKI